MANLMIRIGAGLSAQNCRNALSFSKDKSHSRYMLKALADALSSGDAVDFQIKNDDAAQASATVTCSQAHITADDTIQIGNLTLTAKASGASGAQFNIGASSTASATNLAAAINANSTLLFATSTAAVVTVKAVTAGTQGNAIPIIITQSDNAGLTASGAALSGGLDESAAFVAGKNW